MNEAHLVDFLFGEPCRSTHCNLRELAELHVPRLKIVSTCPPPPLLHIMVNIRLQNTYRRSSSIIVVDRKTGCLMEK